MDINQFKVNEWYILKEYIGTDKWHYFNLPCMCQSKTKDNVSFKVFDGSIVNELTITNKDTEYDESMFVNVKDIDKYMSDESEATVASVFDGVHDVEITWKERAIQVSKLPKSNIRDEKLRICTEAIERIGCINNLMMELLKLETDMEDTLNDRDS